MKRKNNKLDQHIYKLEMIEQEIASILTRHPLIISKAELEIISVAYEQIYACLHFIKEEEIFKIKMPIWKKNNLILLNFLSNQALPVGRLWIKVESVQSMLTDSE
jgi:hypothetical protein